MSERTSIKSNKTDRPKTKVKNDPIISESTLKRKTDKTSEKNKNGCSRSRKRLNKRVEFRH